jgi:hypothetical protein
VYANGYEQYFISHLEFVIVYINFQHGHNVLSSRPIIDLVDFYFHHDLIYHLDKLSVTISEPRDQLI